MFVPKKSDDEPEDDYEEGDGNFTTEKNKPFFNDAGQTLERIGYVLKELIFFNYIYPMDNVEKQRAKIEWVKKFFLMSTSILIKQLTKEEFKKIRDEIFSYRIKRKLIVKNHIQEIKEIYDDNLNDKLDNTISKLQVIVSPFLMPDKREEDEGL